MTERAEPKPFAPAADQNKEAILAVLKDELQAGDKVLELGAGTGQHACYFASHLPQVEWQTSDLASQVPGIRAWVSETGCDNLKSPIALDVCKLPWPDVSASACYSSNTFHIISASAIESVFQGCSAVLASGGRLIVYGPFQIGGEFTAESNARFDSMLKMSDPLSGVRDIDKLNLVAERHGFNPARIIPMPVNNFIAIWQKC